MTSLSSWTSTLATLVMIHQIDKTQWSMINDHIMLASCSTYLHLDFDLLTDKYKRHSRSYHGHTLLLKRASKLSLLLKSLLFQWRYQPGLTFPQIIWFFKSFVSHIWFGLWSWFDLRFKVSWILLPWAQRCHWRPQRIQDQRWHGENSPRNYPQSHQSDRPPTEKKWLSFEIRK